MDTIKFYSVSPSSWGDWSQQASSDGKADAFIRWARAPVADGGCGLTSAQVSDSTLREMFRTLDLSGDSTLDMQEFGFALKVLLAASPGSSSRGGNFNSEFWNAVPNAVKSLASYQLAGKTLQHWLWNQSTNTLNSDATQYLNLSSDEFRKALLSMMSSSLSDFKVEGVRFSQEEIADLLFELLDTDQDQSLSLTELSKAYETFLGLADIDAVPGVPINFDLPDSQAGNLSLQACFNALTWCLKGLVTDIFKRIIDEQQKNMDRLLKEIKSQRN